MCTKYRTLKHYSCGERRTEETYGYCTNAKSRAGNEKRRPTPRDLCADAKAEEDVTETESKCQPNCDGKH